MVLLQRGNAAKLQGPARNKQAEGGRVLVCLSVLFVLYCPVLFVLFCLPRLEVGDGGGNGKRGQLYGGRDTEHK